jgi:AcrR family transcriptional regulator
MSATNAPARAGGDTGDASTRQRVIDAAVACILEEGFYRASSNKIARRAGVTWGVIQYHFGTREGLLLAVSEYSAAEFDAAFANAEITGATLRERLESFADVMWHYYRRPEFLAYMQLTVNLSHDPTAAKRTRESLRDVQVRFARHLDRLMRAVLGDDVDPDSDLAERLSGLLFSTFRGLALDHELNDALPMDRDVVRPDPDPRRTMLADALAVYIEHEASRPSASTP